MEIFIEVTLTEDGHKTEFHVDDCKKSEDGTIDVKAYKKCLEIARSVIDDTIAPLP